MPIVRKRNRTLETPANPNHKPNNDQVQAPETENTLSDYEQTREKRIKENLERMQKLGIVDLSLKLKSCTTPKRTPRSSPCRKPLDGSTPLSPPSRRSSRLQNVTPVSYVETNKKEDDADDRLEEGSKPEVYTEEHEKLLGDCKMSWTLFVDGCGKDGKRIYDSVKGKTCHQCRQKTLGHRTHCSQCGMVQGQFCGDCLYMRYGEHVLEANQNPNWICPVCRGICNCSLCRQAKGWPATGSMYRKITHLGYKSVAHYLIQTRRAQTNTENKSDAKTPVSAKRSLPFKNMEALAEKKEFAVVGDNKLENEKEKSEVKVENEKEKEKGSAVNLQTVDRETLSERKESPEVDCEDKLGDEPNDEKEKEMHLDNKLGGKIKVETVTQISSESEAEVNMMPQTPIKPSPDSIVARLRSRRKIT